MKITIESVANGYLVTTDGGERHIAATIDGWSGVSLNQVLKSLFTVTAPAPAQSPIESAKEAA